MHEPWAQVFTPENQSTEQAQRPANHAKLATSVDFKGAPFVDAKMVQKQQFKIRVLIENNWPEFLEF